MIGSKIINNETLSIDQADTVSDDLVELETTGVWQVPEWAIKMASHYQIPGCETHIVIIARAWRAVAMAYRARI